MKKTVAQLLAMNGEKPVTTTAETTTSSPETTTTSVTDTTTTSTTQHIAIVGGQVMFSAEASKALADAGIVIATGDAEDISIGDAKVQMLPAEGLKVEQTEGVAEMARQLGEMSVAKVSAESELVSTQKDLAAMIGIVSESLNTMSIATGGSAVDVSNMDVTTLVSQHAAVKTQFVKLPVRGVAAVEGVAPPDSQAPAVDSSHLRRVQAVAGFKPQGA